MKTYITHANKYPVTQTPAGEVIPGRGEREGQLFRILGGRSFSSLPVFVATSQTINHHNYVLVGDLIVARACDNEGEFLPKEDYLVTSAVKEIVLPKTQYSSNPQQVGRS